MMIITIFDKNDKVDLDFESNQKELKLHYNPFRKMLNNKK